MDDFTLHALLLASILDGVLIAIVAIYIGVSGK
jgi:hypothetical protein